MTDTLVIAGSRRIKNEKVVKDAWDESPFDQPDEIITGGADGVDQCGRGIAMNYKDIEYREIKPDYTAEEAKSAPLTRNEILAEQGDKLLAVWDGTSVGTRHMIGQALDHSLDIYVKVHRPGGLL